MRRIRLALRLPPDAWPRPLDAELTSDDRCSRLLRSDWQRSAADGSVPPAEFAAWYARGAGAAEPRRDDHEGMNDAPRRADDPVARSTRRQFLRRGRADARRRRPAARCSPTVAGRPARRGGRTSAAQAKRVIYLHMIGAPSQLDLFDHKPELVKRDGQPCPEELLEGQAVRVHRRRARRSPASRVQVRPARQERAGAVRAAAAPGQRRRRHRASSARCTPTRSTTPRPRCSCTPASAAAAGPASARGSTYGLGSENRDLPAYVVLLSGPLGGAGTSLWSSGFLPSVYQGVQFRTSGDPVLFLSNPHGPRRRRPPPRARRRRRR